jgi:dihydrofolate reductase
VRTRIEREFDPDVVRRLKGDARHDITVNGPGPAEHALRAGLVDELQMFVCPAVVGAGKRFFPDRVRLKLELVDKHGSATAWSLCGTLSGADTLAVNATSRSGRPEGPL